MLKVLIFFARFFLLWTLYFFADRLIFLAFYFNTLEHRDIWEITALFYHGLRLDIAMTAYLTVIPLWVFTFHNLFRKGTISFRWLWLYNKILFIFFSLISVINLNIYREWGSKINAKAIDYAFSAPNEALASSASSPILINLTIFALLITFSLFLNKRLMRTNLKVFIAPAWAKIAYTLLMVSFLFLMMRGGGGVSPNNQSMAYYSDELVLNHAAVNTEWNLFSSLLKSGQINHNPYSYFELERAEKQLSEMYKMGSGSSLPILSLKKPNVVIIIMESFTADLTQTLGQESGITPGFDSLVKQGVLFSKIYATGNRTDKGILGTLAGQPSLAPENLVKWPEKLEKIPAISQVLSKNGYQTSFFYGGESEFDNYKIFIMSHNYQLLVDKKKFKAKDMNSKWGAYDGTVFNTQLLQLNKTKQPFFSTVMTLTNHEPFEVPGAYKFGKKDNTQRFKSTAFYTDSCITDYLAKAKRQPWFKNTLFIFVADHGHILPKGREDVYAPQRYHIPLLFFGEVIKKQYRGMTFDHTGSQIDIASTLLHQLKMDASSFNWSKDLLNPGTPSFAFFSWDNGIGFIDNKQCVTFDNVGKMVLYNDHPEDTRNSEKLLLNAKSYMQLAYRQFLAR